jgi:hypothetical protein
LRNNRSETVIGTEARWMIRATRWFPGLVRAGLAAVVRRRYAGGAQAGAAAGH